MQALESSWGSTRALTIPKSESLKPGSWIAVTVSVGSWSKLSFYSRSYKDNTRVVELNKVFYDYSPDYQERTYEIDLHKLQNRTKVYPVYVEILQYAGTPTIEFSLDSEFKSSEKITEARESWIRFEITNS